MPSQARKKTPKKRKRIYKKTDSGIKRDLLILSLLIVLVIAVGTGYYWGKSSLSAAEAKTKPLKKEILLKKDKLPIERDRSLKEPDVGYCKAKPSKIRLWLFESKEPDVGYCRVEPEELDIEVGSTRDRAKTASGREHTKAPILERNGYPKLVIIIDDVATPKQLKKILAVPFKLTPSIFPPSKRLKSTAKMAKNLKHYMIHLPMQAVNHPSGAMPNTLKIKDSKDIFRHRVQALRRWFPSALYVNNHTGSLFTSDHRSMHTLYGVLKEEGFLFLDSRTSHRSKAERVAKEYGDFYLHRDIFLDNIRKYSAIRKQLKLAIKKAKSRGYAIAIGHPHNITLESLKNSPDILAEVEVVYLDELMSGAL